MREAIGPRTANTSTASMTSLTSQRVRSDATILAALRYWAREGIDNATSEIDIASEGGAITPLSAEETDELAERINCGSYAPMVVLNIQGGAIHSATADSPTRVVILDADTEGGSEDRIAHIDGSKVHVTEFLLHWPTAEEAERMDKVIKDLGSWSEQPAVATRTDIQCRQIGRDDFGIEGHDLYVITWSTVDEITEAQAKEWLFARFYCGEPTSSFAALTSVSVMPHTSGSKWVGVLHYTRDV